MRKLVMLAAMLGIVGAVAPAWALSLTWPVVTEPVYIQIYTDTDYLSGTGDYCIYTGTFQGGVTYKFVLVVPWNADFDIKIYDENGNLVASGTNGTGADEVVYLTPIWTGPFTIKVYSYSGSGFYTLKVYEKL